MFDSIKQKRRSHSADVGRREIELKSFTMKDLVLTRFKDKTGMKKITDEMKNIANFDKVSIFNSPITCLRVLMVCVIELLINTVKFTARHIVLLSMVTIAITSFLYLPGPHELVSNQPFHQMTPL